MSESRVLVACLDADGCLYNAKHRRLLIQILCDHWWFFEKYGKKPYFNDKNIRTIKKNAKTILKEIEEADLENTKWDNLFDYITNKEFLIELGMIMEDAQNNGLNLSLNLCIAGVVFNHLHDVEKINEEILINIFLKANKELISSVSRQVIEEKINYVIFESGSNRQSYLHDQYGITQNATGSIFAELYHIQYAVQGLLKKKIGMTDGIEGQIPCEVSQFSMADIYGDKQRGMAYQNVLYALQSPEVEVDHPPYLYDHSKISLLYAISHDVMVYILKQLHIADKKNLVIINFYEDNTRILQALMHVFQSYPDLLPASVRLDIYPYRGEVNKKPVVSIQGTGVVDFHYRQNVKLMARMCGHQLDNFENTIDVSLIDMKQFMQLRVTGHEIMIYPSSRFARLFQPSFQNLGQVVEKNEIRDQRRLE